MSDQDTYYEFISQALPEDEPVSVVSFTGHEGISQLFAFDLTLKSRSQKMDVDALLGKPCALRMTVGGASRQINGELQQWDTIGQSGDFVIYQARLVPRVHALSQYRSNEVHIDDTVPTIIEGVLKQCGLTELDYDFRLEARYPSLPLCCQFDETYLDFISRLMERAGLYYFFEHEEGLDRLIVCDSLRGQDTLDAPSLAFKAPTGQDLFDLADRVHALICRQKRLPARVIFKDYNDENPSVNIQGEAEVDPDGAGEVYDYGSHVNSPDEAKTLARLTAEQLLSEKRLYHGESTVGRLQAGFLVSVDAHPQAAMNRAYQLISIEHEGQSPSLQTGESTRGAGYRNRFTALESNVQYRARRVTAKPRFFGTMNAFIDSETDGEYAQVDSTGRYKVVFPFDRVSRQEAKASCWIRMAQPYAGEGEGMHFPLRKHAEVLLTFIGGDPDRPVIAGAVPNHSKPSVITDQNQTKNVIQTSKGNRIEIEDREDCRRIKLHSPHKNTYMHLGAPNHDGDGWVILTEGLERKQILGGRQVTFDTQGVASEPSTFGGSTDDNGLPDASTLSHGRRLFTFNKQNNDGVASVDGEAAVDAPLEDTDELSGQYLIKRAKGPKYQWHQGACFSYHTGPSLDVRYFPNGPDTAEAAPDLNRPYAEVKEALIGQLYGEGAGYKPSGAQAYGKKDDSETLDDKNWKQVIRDAHVSLSQHDTITAQNGNIYDFGGYWNYNLGNSYEENHLSQEAVLNSNTSEFDILATGGPEQGQLKNTIGNLQLSDPEFRLDEVLGEARGGDVDLADAAGDAVGDAVGNVFGTTLGGLVGDVVEDVVDHFAGDVDSGTFYIDPAELWTTKTYGGSSYDYREGGKAIEVNADISTLEINKGGTHVEMFLNNEGKKIGWSLFEGGRHSGGGKSYERKWHPKTGNLFEKSEFIVSDVGYNAEEILYNPVSGGINSIDTTFVDSSGVGSDSICLTNGRYSSFHSGSYNSTEIYNGALLDMSISVAAKSSIDFSASGSIDVEIHASLGISLSSHNGIKLTGAINVGPEIKFGQAPMEIDVMATAAEVSMNSLTGRLALKLASAEITAVAALNVRSEGQCNTLKAAGFEVTA